jgi:hypothetical protein
VAKELIGESLLYPGQDLSQIRRGRRQKYPWEEWTNGSVWEVNSWEFQVEGPVLRSSLRQQAKKRGLRVVIRAGRNASVFKFQFIHLDQNILNTGCALNDEESTGL